MQPKLYPFQRAGVAFLATAKQALLTDEMGLGKGPQTIATLEVIGEDAYPALIVCQNSMKLTWAEEFARWAPGRTVVVVAGTPTAKRKAIASVRDGAADVAIINYESLRSLTRVAGYGSMTLSDKEKEPKELNEIPWRTVVADEAHSAKDPKSKQTRALWWLGDHTLYRYALTGTPIANSPADAWSLMRFVSPTEFPAKTKFIERYALQSWNIFGGLDIAGLKPEASAEFFSIVDPRMIRRLKSVVMPQLPAKTYTTRYCEMGDKQKKAYNEMRKDMLAALDGGVLMAQNPLVKQTRLVQFASACGELVPNGGADEWGNATTDLKLIAPSCKADAMLEIAAELGGAKCVVFAESPMLVEITAAALIKAGYKVAQITGAVAPHDRQINLRDFNEGSTQILLITLAAGGTGLSIKASNIAVFLQRSFNAVLNAQAEDRVHGIGRGIEGLASEIIDVVTQGTIESRVHEVRREKAAMLEEFVRDEKTVREWLSKP